MSFATSSWLAFLLSLLVLSVAAQEYSITAYGVAGTGCASSAVSASSSGTDVALKYRDFTAYAGPSYTYADGRKNCQLTLSVQVPSGYQFAFNNFSHNASYSIAPGVTASFSSRYYFQATLPQGQGNGSFSGPTKSDPVELAAAFRPIIWSPCGKNTVVAIDTAVRVDNGDGSASGSLTVHNTPSNSFIWRTC